MNQLPEFLLNHPILTAAWFAVAGVVAWTFLQSSRGGQRLTPAEVTRFINSKDAVVLDVRAESEFSQGHILNAENVPLSDLADQVARLDKYRARPVITTCRAGQQSSSAAGVLRKAGFEQVYNLAGGILAWQEASLPLSKKK